MTSIWETAFKPKLTKQLAPKKKRSSKNISRKLQKMELYRPRKRDDIPPRYEHQNATLELTKITKRVFDISDPGTGKTRASLDAWYLRRQQGGKKMLVLAPKTLLQPAWGDDIEKFIPEASYVIAYAHNREVAFNQDVDIYITNIDAAKWLVLQKPKFFKQFDTLIIDESTVYKHRTSARSKAARKIAKNFEYRTLMTGTPNPVSVTELWHQMLILDDGTRLGTSFFRFKESVQDSEQTGPMANHRRWFDKPGAEIAVANLISDITIRHKFEDCIDIPDTHIFTVKYTPSKKVMDAYNLMRDTAIIELHNEQATAINAASLRTKLLQIASGCVYGDGNALLVDVDRYEMTIELVKQREHTVVFFNWTHQRQMLTEIAEKEGLTYCVIDGSITSIIKRNKLVKEFQEGKYDVCFLHPETGAHGLTLTTANTVIWSSPIDRADWLKQGKHRIVRAGQKKKTEIICIEAEYTLEEKVYMSLYDKSGRMNNLLEMLEE